MIFIALFLLLLPMCSRAQESDSIAKAESLPPDTIPAVKAKPCVVIEDPLVPGRRKNVPAWREMSYIPLPLFLSGIIVRERKKDIRGVVTNFHRGYENQWDNYVQYAPFALTIGLKAGGVEGHSKWGRLLASSAMSYATMALLVNSMKYTVKELRPDGSSRNSFPSGHTATAFASATILHKEYGLTRSLWYSVAGYSIASTTGIMRILNNRHWASDVLAGAAIGIVSVDFGYFLGDVIFKDKHIIRPYREHVCDFYESPSFASLNVGYGMFEHTLQLGKKQLRANRPISTRGELAYYFNPYIGIGTRLSVESSTITDNSYYDHMGIFSLAFGAYATYPVSSRFAIGAKLLGGHMATNAFEFDSGISCDKSRSFTLGVGTNVAYAYRHNLAWRFNVEYDWAKPRLTLYNKKEEIKLHKSIHQLTLSCSMNVMF